jgi:two-component sensor histidine kinase
VTGQSQPWSAVDFRIAEALRVSLLEVILRLTNLTEVERRRVLERQEVLIAELNHRVRNILSLIRGVVSQSKDSATTVESFTQVVGGRIHALARAHDQITADNGQPASFRSLVNAETGAYLGGKATRVVMLGPDVLLEPQAFTTLALVVHELVTNSAKYGALSDSRGRVEVATAIDTFGRFTIDWSEYGGPPVKPPTRRGFGSTIIESSIPHDLSGESELDFAAGGVRGRFMIPAAFTRPANRSSEADADQANPAMAESNVTVDSGTKMAQLPRDILLVEDNLIIALDTEDMLRSFGVETVRIASGLAEALKAIDEKPPEAALLDVNLGGDTSYEIAKRLEELGAPFVFATGYQEEIAFPDSFQDVRRLRKPYSAEALRETIEGLVSST